MPRASREPSSGPTFTRRQALRGAAALAAAGAAMSFVGCDDDSTTGESTPAPQAGGTLRFATSLRMAYGLDPQVEQGSALAIIPKVYGYLLRVNPANDEVIYDHASSYEQPDDTTVVVSLQPGIRFHDVAPVSAREVVASDVVATIERFRDNPIAVDKTWHATILEKAEAYGNHAVVVRLKRPYVYTLHELGAVGAGAIIPREVIATNENIARRAIGSGPFRHDTIDVDAGSARIIRNDAYFAERAHVDAMQWTVLRDDEQRLTTFRRRDADLIPNHDRSEADALTEFSLDVEVVSEPSLSYLSMGLRVDKPPLNDERVRRAIDMLLDRDELIREIAFGDGDILGPVNPRIAGGFWALPRSEIAASRNASDPPDARTAEATALLTAANAQDTLLLLQVRDQPDLIDVAAVVRNQLLRGGIRTVVEVRPDLEWFVNFRGGAFDATLISHLPYESPDYPTRFFHSRGIDGDGNMFGFADATIDALIERSWGEQDRERRRETLLGAQQLMLNARPMLQLFTSTGYSSGWNYVHDRPAGLLGSMAQHHYRYWLDEGAPGRS
jgi:ABC-type transport system substrate-binding protein